MNTQVDNRWVADTELDNFECKKLTAHYHQREFCATLIRARNNPTTAPQAVLYIHGLTDYFFQVHLADAYRRAGYAFYALDLHGYGRSLKPHERANYCEQVAEYYPEIDAAIGQIKSDGFAHIVINAHSTGGLIASLYAHEGRHRQAIVALYLNSPFFEFPFYGWERFILRALVAVGRVLPNVTYHHGIPSQYAHSLHRDFKGEWQYNKTLKPAEGFPIRAGWVRAIYRAQRRVQQGLSIHCPVLVMHSARSIRALRWSDELFSADAVLNIDHMRRFGPLLGQRVTLIAIDGAMHDIALSAPRVRDNAIKQTLTWLQRVLPADAP
jgi:alpha-beta hydrolase superfamily lysophospholipase